MKKIKNGAKCTNDDGIMAQPTICLGFTNILYTFYPNMSMKDEMLCKQILCRAHKVFIMCIYNESVCLSHSLTTEHAYTTYRNEIPHWRRRRQRMAMGDGNSSANT